MKLVAVNSLGNMVGLNFKMAFGVTTRSIKNGIYAMIHHNDGEVKFLPEKYIGADSETYQLPLPVFGA